MIAGYYSTESNLTAGQPRRLPRHVIQTTTSKELAQGLSLVARVGFEPVTLRTQGTELTTEPIAPDTCIETGIPQPYLA